MPKMINNNNNWIFYFFLISYVHNFILCRWSILTLLLTLAKEAKGNQARQQKELSSNKRNQTNPQKKKFQLANQKKKKQANKQTPNHYKEQKEFLNFRTL